MAAFQARGRALLYGFLVLPSAVVLAFVALAFLLTSVDATGGNHGVAGFGGDAARSILSTIATALITVAGLTFSIMIVSLQLVSQQFSPRAMRNFLGDHVTQLVAGSFVGIFAYCLLVLRTVRQGDGGPEFVPGLSVSVSIALGVLTLGLLLVFIHHMSQSIQLSSIAARITREASSALETLYPEPFGEERGNPPRELLARWSARGAPERVHPPRPGFVQTVELDALVEARGLSDVRLHVAVAPGDFVTGETVLAELWPADEKMTDAVRGVIAVGSEREVAQDVGYALGQLSYIAIRALSPGVNDPTTAVTCIGYLQDVLERLAERRFPAAVRRYDDAGVVAVLRRSSFTEHLDKLLEVGRHAREIDRVHRRVREALEQVAAAAARAGAVERAAATRCAARNDVHAGASPAIH